jgi:WD40 repeat protein
MQLSRYIAIVFLFISVKSVAQSPTLVLQKGHFKKINSIRFSPDRKKIVTTSDDEIIKVWDVFSQKLLAEMGGNGIAYLDAYFSPDNRYIVAHSEQPGEDENFGPSRDTYNNPQYYMLYNNTPVYIWDTETSQLVYSTSNKHETHRISPDAKLVAVHHDKIVKTLASSNKESIRDAPISIYDIATGKLFRTIEKFEDSTTDAEPFIEFLSDSTLLTGIQTFLPQQKNYLTTYHVFNFINNTEVLSFSDTSRINKNGGWVMSPGRKYFLRYNEELLLFHDSINTREAYTELWDIYQQKKIWEAPIRLRNLSFGDHDSTVSIIHESSSAKYTEKTPYTRYVTHISIQDAGKVYQVKGEYKGDVLASNSPNRNSFVITGMETSQHDLPVPYADTVYRINVWDAAHNIKSNCKVKTPVTAVLFSPERQCLLTGYDDGNFSVWDTGDTLAKEIANSGNIIDPIKQIRSFRSVNKILYVTKSMYGIQDNNSINQLSWLLINKFPVKDMHFLLHDKYTFLNTGAQYQPTGEILLINNDSPALVKSIPYEGDYGTSLIVQGDSGKTDLFNNGRWTTKLNYPGLKSFTLYNNTVSYDNPRRHTMRPDITLNYGILKSTNGSDTALMSNGAVNFKYNDQRKGFIFTYDIPYYIRKSALVNITPVFPKTGTSFLSDPVISDDGRLLLGPDRFSIDTNVLKYLYCQDLQSNTVFKTPVVFQSEKLGTASQFIISPNKASACILSDPALASGAQFVRVVKTRDGVPLYNLKLRNSGSVLGVVYTMDSKYVYSWSEGGTCTKWDLSSGTEIYTIVFFQDHDYAIILPDGYYFISSRTDVKYLNFKLNNRLYNFSQFDLQFNRPDKVLKAIGSADKALMEEYNKAWQGRVKKSGFTDADFTNSQLHVPEIQVEAEDLLPFVTAQELRFSFTAIDSLYNIRSYNLYVNDVPLNGINGRVLVKPSQSATITQKLLLSEGMNKIEVSCTNEKGASSRKEAIYISYAPVKQAPHKTYFIGIGINQYSAHSSFVDLSYCVKDIRDLSVAFKEKFKESLVIDTLMNDDASKENILALKLKLMQTNVDDRVIISFSGHGMVDPQHPGDFYFVTSTTDANNPAVNAVSYAQLEELMDSIPARKKLILLDACHSGESNDSANAASNHIPGTKRGNDDKDKNKAGSIEILDVVENNDRAHASSADIFKLMKEAFVDIRRNNGAYVLSAAQSNESAGEGGGISNGWFSSCLIEQLKQIGSMSVNELSRKVNQCVSAKSGGNQNTDNRQEPGEYNWQVWE